MSDQAFFPARSMARARCDAQTLSLLRARALSSMSDRGSQAENTDLIGRSVEASSSPPSTHFSFPAIRRELAFPETAAALFTFSEAATRLRVSERTLRLLVSRHRPPAIKAGRRVLFDEIAINHLIESLRCHSKSSPARGPGSFGSRAPSAVNAFERALALTTGSSPRRSAPRAKPALSGRRSTATD